VDVTYRSGSAGAGAVTWTKMGYLQNPMQCHIIAALVDLPIVEYRTGVFAKMVTHLRGDLARELV
jgi:hypothetical protein